MLTTIKTLFEAKKQKNNNGKPSPIRARRLQFEPLEERALLSANPDVIFSVDRSGGYGSSNAVQGGVLGFGPNSDDIDYTLRGDSFKIESYAEKAANYSWLEGEATNSGGKYEFTATLFAYMFYTPEFTAL